MSSDSLFCLREVLVRRAIAVMPQRHPLAWRALPRAGGTLQRLPVDVQTVLRQAADVLIDQPHEVLDHSQHPQLRADREVGSDVSKECSRRSGEMAAVGHQSLDRRLTVAQYALVISPGPGATRVFDDLIRELAVDGPAKSVCAVVHGRLLLAGLPAKPRRRRLPRAH